MPKGFLLEDSGPLRQQFLDYLRIERRYSDATSTAYASDLDQLAEYLAAGYEIDLYDPATFPKNQLESKHLRSWLASLGLKRTSIARKVSALKTYFKYCRTQGLLAVNPAQHLQKPKPERRLPAWVPELEMGKLLDSCALADDFAGARDRLLLELLYGCGLRRAEVIGLQQQDVDVAQKSLRVLGKGRKERVVPFGEAVVVALAAYKAQLAQQDFEPSPAMLLTDTGRPLYPGFVNTTVKRYLLLIPGLAKATPHVLRHSFATHLMDHGAELTAVKELLGHSSLAATQVYLHNSVQKLKDAHKKAHPKAGRE